MRLASPLKENLIMNKLRKQHRADNAGDTLPPLLALIERDRWQAVPRAARLVSRRYGIRSASTARAIAEAAGFAMGDRR